MAASSAGGHARVAHYRLIQEIGAGGSGIVFEAEDLEHGRHVALKRLAPQSRDNRMTRKRFIRAARACADLAHPNICQVLEVGDDEADPYLVMELLRGETLRQRVARGALETTTLLGIAEQLASGLQAAHDRHIVHRDLKPTNVFLVDDDRVKIVDFGIAKEVTPLDSSTTTSTATPLGVPVGTISYMSPEQVRGLALDPRSDLFSLGVVLYELACGRVPFAGRNALETIDRILHAEPMLLTRVTPAHPPELARMIGRLLAKDPRHRYQSANELPAEIVDVRRTLDVAAGARAPGSSDRRVSIAVLPFRTLGPAESAYLGEGLAEDLIAELAGVGSLRVCTKADVKAVLDRGMAPGPEDETLEAGGTSGAGTSAGQRPPPDHWEAVGVGAALGLDAVVHGSVQEHDDRLRITVALIDVGGQQVVWSAKYDQSVRDLFSLQDEISTAVARAAQMSFVTRRSAVTARDRASSVDAYKSYLKGRFYWSKRYEVGLTQAQAEFTRAVHAEPTYAPAHAGLADTHTFAALYSLRQPTQAFEEAQHEAERALSLDPDLAQAHTSVALIRLGADWNWIESRRSFERALRLDPNQALPHVYYSWLLILMNDPRLPGREGRLDEAEPRVFAEAFRQVEEATALEPVSPVVTSGAAYTHFLARRFDTATRLCEEVLDIEPSFLVALYIQGLCLEQQDRLADAHAYLSKAVTLSGNAPFFVGLLGKLLAEMGERSAARELLDRLSHARASYQRGEGPYVPPHALTYILVGLGEIERALDVQEQACAEGAAPFNYLAPNIAGLHDHPRHLEQLRRMGYAS